MRISDWSSDVCSSDLDDALSRSPQPRPQIRGVADLLDSLIASEGTGAPAHVRSGALSSGVHAMCNLADAVHFLCLLHARHPGLIDAAARNAVDPASRPWMEEAEGAFAPQTAFISRSTAAA